MAINIRKVGEVADNSVTAEKLADNAVDLTSAKVTGQLPTEKLADGAVVEEKLAELSVATGKLKNNVVTLAKAHDDIKVSHFVGDEEEVQVTGTVEVDVKEFSFPKKGGYDVMKMRFLASIKTNDVLKTASLKVYIDDEAEARGTLTTTSITYELNNTEFDISDLAQGKHKVTVKLSSDAADGIVYNDMIDALLIK